MFSIITSLVSKIGIKNLGLGIIFLGLIAAIGIQTYRVNSRDNTILDLQGKIDVLNMQLTAAEDTITALESEKDLKANEATEINDQLAKCYTRLTEREEALNQVDEIMNNKEVEEEEPTEEVGPVISGKTYQKEIPYEPVTFSQMTRGLKLVNTQMQKVK